MDSLRCSTFSELPTTPYLKDLFTRLPAAKLTEIKAFTPAVWTKAKAKEEVIAQAA
jgi:hypothetical protein